MVPVEVGLLTPLAATGLFAIDPLVPGLRRVMLWRAAFLLLGIAAALLVYFLLRG